MVGEKRYVRSVIKMARELTEEERKYISRLSVRSPMTACRFAKMLKERSYRISGRTFFFTPPKKDEEEEG